MPTLSASSQVIASVPPTRGESLFLSTKRMIRPPTMNAEATGTALNRCALMYAPKARPSTAAGMKATIRFSHSFGSTRNRRARYSQITARTAPVWIAMSNTLPRSSFAPRRSLARIRCPVLEIGRNSVSPSTTPRISASRISICFPRMRVRCRCYCARRPAVRPTASVPPGRIQPARMLGGNDLVLRRDKAEQRHGDLRRPADRVEAMLQHPIYREVRVMALCHFDQAVERRNQDHPGQRALCGQLHGYAATQAAAEKKHVVRFQLPGGVFIPGEPVGGERRLGRRAFARAVAAVVDQQPADARRASRRLLEHPGDFLGVAAEVKHQRGSPDVPGVQAHVGLNEDAFNGG